MRAVEDQKQAERRNRQLQDELETERQRRVFATENLDTNKRLASDEYARLSADLEQAKNLGKAEADARQQEAQRVLRVEQLAEAKLQLLKNEYSQLLMAQQSGEEPLAIDQAEKNNNDVEQDSTSVTPVHLDARVAGTFNS